MSSTADRLVDQKNGEKSMAGLSYRLIAVPRPWVTERMWSWFSAVSGAWPLPWLIVRQPLKWIFTMTPRANTEEILDQMYDLLLNFECPCVGTEFAPCSRCQVSIDQSNEMLDRFGYDRSKYD